MAAFRNALERASEPANTMDASRLAEMKRILSPFFRGENALLDRMYPGRAFPCLQVLEFPTGSWSTALLDTVTMRPHKMRSTEAQLGDALRQPLSGS